MPFHIQDVPAYRELVLDELRKQARTSGTKTHNILQSNPGNYPDGNPVYDSAIYKMLNRAHGCYNTLDKVLWYCYCYMPQHFDAFQRVMQMEEEDTANLQYGDTFRRRVFNTDGDLLVVDFGCGPMTAGLALADWYYSTEHKPLKLSYVGIDDSEHCRNFASQFAARDDLFFMQSPQLFGTSCSSINVDELKNRVTSNGTLLFIFSYALGQHTCEQEHLEEWALFARQLMTACGAKHNLVVYTNSTWNGREDTDNKYKQFAKMLYCESSNLPTEGVYQERHLKHFNEPTGPIVISKGPQNFRHHIVDATLVNEKGIPIREDKRS
jgi:hypothetical protein